MKILNSSLHFIKTIYYSLKDSENGEQILLRFTSRNDTSKHYVELKPYNRQKFEGSEYLN